MFIRNFIPPIGDQGYYTAGYRQIVEDNMAGLRAGSLSNLTHPNGLESTRHRGDLYGYLATVGVPPEHMWATMRVNNLQQSSDWVYEGVGIMLIDPSVLRKLLDTYLSRKLVF